MDIKGIFTVISSSVASGSVFDEASQTWGEGDVSRVALVVIPDALDNTFSHGREDTVHLVVKGAEMAANFEPGKEYLIEFKKL